MLVNSSAHCKGARKGHRSQTIRNVFGMMKSMISGVKQEYLPPKKLQLGQVSPRRPVPKDIPRPWYSEVGGRTQDKKVQLLKKDKHIDSMRASCKLAANILAEVESIIVPGTTTDQIDNFVHWATINAGAYPSPLNYGGFLKSCCTSVNECVVHGVPDDRPLEAGDVVCVDVTCFYRGFHGDTARTFIVGGEGTEPLRKLLAASEEAVHVGFRAVQSGLPMNVVGQAISDYLLPQGFQAFDKFVGHGVGREFHPEPVIFHVPNTVTDIIEPGMTFTIEPSVTPGSVDVRLAEDEHSFFAADGAITMQFEHTIYVTKDGPELLTIPDPQEVRQRIINPQPPSTVQVKRRRPKFASQQSQ